MTSQRGGTLALLLLVLAVPGACNTTTTPTPEPLVATADGADFVLVLTTPRSSYGPSDPIEPVATVTFVGPAARVTWYQSGEPIHFRIEEVGGSRIMDGAFAPICTAKTVGRAAPETVQFGKSGPIVDDPTKGFNRAWYDADDLLLPVGTWRIIASLDISLGDCGGPGPGLAVENVVSVVP